MSDPTEEATAPPAPDPDGDAKPARGPTPAKLDTRQRAELLDLVGKGQGLYQALRSMGLSFRVYRNTIRARPAYRREVAAARKAADEALDEVGYLRAFEASSGDEGATEVLFRIWERRDRSRDLIRSRADRRRERADDLRQKELDRALRLHLAEMDAEAKARARAEKDSKPDDDAGKLDLSRLTPEQLAGLRDMIATILPAGDDGDGTG